jgi:transcriptional regulator with XRE-family HTH domain
MLLITHQPPIVNSKDESFFKDLGARIAQLRKQRSITQVQLCATLGIAQQTLAHYEGGKLRLPISLLPALATALDTNVQDLIGQPKVKATATAKRGPASKLEQQVQQIAQLPRTQQRFVSQMLDTILAQAAR